ncbi:MAG: aminoacyl-tRNA hydrolase [bacterium]|nr:aminoacyl-tRNA hydrolase [bacterium]
MQWTVAGLGNPGKEYIGTRHNVGREFLEALARKLPPKTKIVLPDTYMNNSGRAFDKLVTSKKAAERLVVLHDDLDLPLGSVKISFGSGSGGHKGVESIQQALKTKDFVRIRIGISPRAPSGRTKKPDSTKVNDFVLGKFSTPEVEKLKKARKTVAEALEILLADPSSAGQAARAHAMTAINSKR